MALTNHARQAKPGTNGGGRNHAGRDGSIYPYRNGYAAYSWVISPSGERARQYVYGKSRDIVHQKWLALQSRTSTQAPANTPPLGEYLTTWLAEVVQPNREPATYAYYETMVRLYISPTLGHLRLNRLQASDVQAWLCRLANLCQCCIQEKDAARPEQGRRCCAVGNCCHERTGARTIQAARNTLRTALNHAIASDKLITRNVAALVKAPGTLGRGRTGANWSTREANRFLASARDDGDPLYAAYVLVLVNGLTRGEVLGLVRPSLDLDSAELDTSWQLQRVGTQLIHKKRISRDSDAEYTVPLTAIGSTALKQRLADQDAARERAGDRWQSTDLVFTTRWGTPDRTAQLQPQLRRPLRQGRRPARSPA